MMGMRKRLAKQIGAQTVKRSRQQLAVLVPLIVGVLIAFSNRHQFFGRGVDTLVRVIAVFALALLGWLFARDIGRAVGPWIYRRLDPATAGIVGFLVSLATIVVTVIAALWVSGLDPHTLILGGAFTAVIIGLAAQQTLGNLFAGIVLVTAHPFRVGELVRLQAGMLAGTTEGIVSSLGLMYTTLARGEDRIKIPNSSVLAAAVVPLREPDGVDVRVRLRSGIRPSQVQAILDDGITTPTRSRASVLLEELDGDEVIVRVQATPESARDGAALADEVIAALQQVTQEHAVEAR
jgi:small-conductance mechanosensitive channel